MELSNANAGDYVEIPLLYYPGYTAKDGDGNKMGVRDGANHVMRIYLDHGTEFVKIKYSGFWYFKIADIISLLTVLGMIALWFKNRSGRIKV